MNCAVNSSIPVVDAHSPDRPKRPVDRPNQILAVTVRVTKISLLILANFGSSIINPGLFYFGFFAGIAFKEESSRFLSKIQDVWDRNISNKLAMLAVGMVSLPFSLATATFLIPLYTGSAIAIGEPIS